MAEPIILTLSDCKIGSVVWNLNWRNDNDVKRLAKKFSAGPYAYQLLCCEIGMAGGFIAHDDLDVIADLISGDVDTLRTIVEEAAQIGLLEVTPHGITSKRIQREIERTIRMKLKKKNKGECDIIFPWTALSAAVVAPGATDSALAQQYKGKQSQDQAKESQGGKFSISLPGEFNTPGIIKGFELWGKKSDQNGRPLSEIGIEAILCQFGGRPKALERALFYSAGLSKCMNLLEPPADALPNPSKQPLTPQARQILGNVGLRDGPKVPSKPPRAPGEQV